MDRIYLNDDWYFSDKFDDRMLKPDFDFSNLELVRLPHTTHIFNQNYTNARDYEKQCLYFKTITYKERNSKEKYILTIEAAAHYAKLYVNGSLVCDHSCGYAAFHADITSYLHNGEDNVVAIFVDSNESLNQPPFGGTIDYATFGGIYREVYLDIKSCTYFTDLFFETVDVNKKEKKLVTQVEVNEFEGDLSIHQTILGFTNCNNEYTPIPNPEQFFRTEHIQQILLENGQRQERSILADIHLWNTTEPILYEIKTQLLKEHQIVDERIDRIGFREIRWESHGFYLNGEKIKLRGLNRHQSYPYVGYAMPRSQQRRDADLLKYELGVNAVRTSHYPQSKYFIERCDELGLLVFTEIPGWQHIGDGKWQSIACENVKEMIIQYRNHPSIILWGVRINESSDLDSFYLKTNNIAHKLDCSRATGGVRYIKNSHLLEDVYTYNDFSHDGRKKCVEKKKNVTKEKAPYLVTEFNGHMYPTKSFDCEEHCLEHALRHAKVMNGYYKDNDILGGFGWCMFDYQTHSDFGSGDCICYHGVLDMFRNPKLAAYLYQSQQEAIPVLEVSSSMDVGEHPGSILGPIYIFTNADQVKFYKNDEYITTFKRTDHGTRKKSSSSSMFENLLQPPILMDDMVGQQLEKEGYSEAKAKEIKKLLFAFAQGGFEGISLRNQLLALKLRIFYHLRKQDAIQLYGKYIGNWGMRCVNYRFEAIKDDKVVKVVEKGPITSKKLWVEADHNELIEDTTYDVAAIRIRMLGDKNQNLRYERATVWLKVEGNIELIGPSYISLPGGMGGTYIKTIKKAGKGKLTVASEGVESVTLYFEINCAGGI